MLKNYFPSISRPIISLIIILLFTTISFAQQTATITTTSNDANWVVSFQNIGGSSLAWQAIGPGINISATGNNPLFDFSPNVGNGDILITITSNDNFDFTTVLIAPGRNILSVDITKMNNLVTLELHNNSLTFVDLSTNTLLENLEIVNNPSLTCIQVENEVDANTGNGIYANWLKDPMTVYSEDCSTFGLTYVPDDVFEQQLIDKGYDDVLDDYVLTSNIMLVQTLSLFADYYSPNLSSSTLKDMTGIEDFRNLEEFNFSDNIAPEGVKQMNLSSLNKLKYLKIYLDDTLNDLILPSNGSLEELILVDVRGLKILDTDSCKNLISLGLSEVEIEKIDITKNLKLESFSINEASEILGPIDFTKNTLLKSAGFYITNLEKIDLSKNENLERFGCESLWNLNELNLKNGNNYNMTPVTIKNLKLTCVQVDDAEYSTTNWTNVDSSISFSEDCSITQSKITIVTTSDFSAWNLAISNPTSLLDWTAVGPGINLTETNTNTPTFDFSPNAGFGDVTVETNGTAANFAGITFLMADNGVGLQIKSVDLSDLPNLEILRLDDNILTTIDLSNNPNLIELNLNRNDLTSLDLSSSPALEELRINANVDLPSLDLSNNPNLETLSASELILITTLDISNNPQLDNINLANMPLTSASIDAILNNLDSFGKSNGIINLQNKDGGVVTRNGIEAYINLLNKGWFIIPAQEFDFGDAPDSYGTLLSSGGAIHLNDPLHDELRIGNSKDYESNGLPGVDADGDDLDQFDDEDGVAQSEFNGINDSSTSVDIDIDLTSNYNNSSYIHAWIDFDGNGTFDSDEYSTLVVPANFGISTFTMTWDITASGANIVGGKSYARFRLTKDSDLTSYDSGGYATGGEVEDYSLIIQGDTDKDGVPNIDDDDADNDGILNTNEVGDTNGNGIDDMLELDSDDDTCLDVTEAGFTDGDGDGILGTSPVVVDANGLITDDALGPIGDGFTTPNDLDINGTYDFQEAGISATITTEPTDQDLIIGVSTFSVVATADTYQWQEDKQDGNGFVDIVDGGDYAAATTPDLRVSNSDDTRLKYRYIVIVSNIAFACDPTVTSHDVGYTVPEDSDIILENTEFEENSPINELTKIFFTNNIYSPHTFTLVDGNGSDDNEDFSITGDVLSKKIIFDYETKKEYLIRIKAEDSLGFSMEKAFVITVINVNDIVITGDVTSNTCSTGNSGSIETFIDQVIPPLSFKWSSGETTQNISNKATGTYTFTVKDSEGMEKSKVFEIETLPTYNDLSICYVTSDDVETFNNRIFISNEGAYNIDKVEILREGNVQGQYDVIGEINPNEESYLDLTSDNQTVSYNYKVRIKDNCGVDSESSSLHKTILLQANKAADGSINLNWSAYEGVSYGTYDIYRKEKQNNAQFELLASISASNLSYNDTDANSNTKSYDYYIGINIPPCFFTMPNQANKSMLPPIVTIKSNIKIVESTLGIDDEILSASLKIYPNPVTDVLTVKSKLELKSIEVYNLLGQEVKVIDSDFESINTNDLSKGIYMIKIYSENGSTVRKLIKD